MNVLVRELVREGWLVWVTLEPTETPEHEHESFVIGQGPSREDAIAAAVAELEEAIGQLRKIKK